MRETTEFRVKVIKDLINLYHRVCVTNSVNRIESDLGIEVGDECLESLEMLFDQILPISKNRSVSAIEKNIVEVLH